MSPEQPQEEQGQPQEGPDAPLSSVIPTDEMIEQRRAELGGHGEPHEMDAPAVLEGLAPEDIQHAAAMHNLTSEELRDIVSSGAASNNNE